ncbi:MAG: hypothetical protein GX094_09045 [Clostridiales bacterium]|nr:hypothetical protein [Clostridiales bacterium]
MYTLKGDHLKFTVDKLGNVASFYNFLTKHEYIHIPGVLWRIIYKEGERMEIPIYSTGQRFVAQIDTSSADQQTLTIVYEGLQGDDRVIDISLTLRFVMDVDRLTVKSFIDNREEIEIMEFQLFAASGIRSLSGNPEQDAIAWPQDLGRRIPHPALTDLSKYAGFRKYERRDEIHTALSELYPGRLSMQWYDLYNENEGIYVGAHNASHQTVCLHVERDTKTNIIRLGVIQYPIIKKGEKWESEPVVYAPHSGDWHAGAKIYREWIESTGWKPPKQPEWIRQFKGWLRVILKQHHGEVNWDYSQIPLLYDEAAESGIDTIFLLGWEKGGFARMWPDYIVDERMGGEEELRKAIDYVHSRGGRVVLFLSYALIDRQSEFYKSGKGEEATIKSLWGTEIPFSETYCGEGTWRKKGSPPMPMFLACSGSTVWQEKMLESARYCLDLGVDGVLYDLGGITPYFCYDDRHEHKKPNYSCATKDLKYKALHDYVRSRGSDKAIMMEHNIDIFAQHMDISQGSTTKPNPNNLLELYRYTFPELIMTNRECGQDEENYKQLANYSFVYGLRYDMTIFRCCGTLSDIPNYAAYLKHINEIRSKYSDYLLKGRFTDNEGFTLDNTIVVAKSYRAEDGSMAVALWNPSDEPQSFAVQSEDGITKTGKLQPESITVVTF